MDMADCLNGEQFWPECALLAQAIELALIAFPDYVDEERHAWLRPTCSFGTPLYRTASNCGRLASCLSYGKRPRVIRALPRRILPRRHRTAYVATRSSVVGRSAAAG